MKYKRVLLKISGEALSSKDSALCEETILATAEKIAALQKQGVEIGVVVGGGNIMRGRSAGEMERNRADHMGMLATAINALALSDALCRLHAPNTVLSAVDMPRFCDTFSSRAAKSALEEGKVVIFACGSGCPFFSTDTAAALRAAEIGADVLLLAKNVDAVYSDDPKTNPQAVRYSNLTYDRVIAENLHATDLTAITLCREQGIPIHVFALKEILSVFASEGIGTYIQ
jgi:uridylate kinase